MESLDEIKTDILRIWKDEICSKEDEVDPNQEYIWEGIFVGLCIGHGLTAEEARDLYKDKGCDLESES